ncbi:MAG: N-acetylmuramoyl-L-alanine amidase [Candidatus Gastranaerophilales bacterium]|nr:N-acetylmuramoyl-L-alanine amidase [Candidatus Gastranaerophilales bacterium]
MKKYIAKIALLFVFISISLFLVSNYSKAFTNYIQIIYPKNNQIIFASSTFIVGNTSPDSSLVINNKSVKVFPSGSFVHVVNLIPGKNTISIRSNNYNQERISILSLTRKNPPDSSQRQIVIQPIPTVLIETKGYTAVRKNPGNPIRLFTVKKDNKFYADALAGGFYRVKLGNTYAYVAKKDVEADEDNRDFITQVIQNVQFEEDERNTYIKIEAEEEFPVELKASGNTLTAVLYYSKINVTDAFMQENKTDGISKIYKLTDNTLSIKLSSPQLNGYDYFYDDDYLIIKIAKPFSAGLKGKVVAVDPGHGGKDQGSVGPTAIAEKDINLGIASYLKDELEKAGATVIMTRSNDIYMGLYDRVDKAFEENADILVSIHNNAHPDGVDPYEIHGTSTYYYNDNAKFLAENIQDKLVRATGFKNLGIKTASFALTRPSYPVSVIVEVGFMINPYEYEKLIQKSFQKQAAEGIKTGIEAYFNNISEKSL